MHLNKGDVVFAGQLFALNRWKAVSFAAMQSGIGCNRGIRAGYRRETLHSAVDLCIKSYVGSRAFSITGTNSVSTRVPHLQRSSNSKRENLPLWEGGNEILYSTAKWAVDVQVFVLAQCRSLQLFPSNGYLCLCWLLARSLRHTSP